VVVAEDGISRYEAVKSKAVTVLQSALPPRRTVTTSYLFRTIEINGVNIA
jgi:hypothetical protein